MPTPVRIGVLIAVLALLVPSAALAQSGGDGGAGDSQYQDPFGTQTQSKPAKPAAPAQQQQQPAQQQTTPAPAPTAQSAQSQSQTQPPAGQQPTPSSQSLPRTGFDVLPVAAAGLLLLLGGLALWRRPHGER